MNRLPLIPLMPCCINKAIPLAFDESLSYLEMVCKLIYNMNQLQEEIEPITENLNILLQNIQNLSNELTDLSKQVTTNTKSINYILPRLNKAINDINNINASILKINQDIINNYNTLNTKIDDVKNELQEQIDNIDVTHLLVLNPITGTKTDIEKAINDVYGALRYFAITSAEYDELELTAEEYDNKEIEALNYDIYGKNILMPSN